MTNGTIQTLRAFAGEATKREQRTESEVDLEAVRGTQRIAQLAIRSIEETLELPGVRQALQEGYQLHGFSSGGGLRVIRLDKEGVEKEGYGEHPHVEGALILADEDFQADGRPYKEVYGKTHEHYLTGAQQTSSPLDLWLRKGSTVDAWQDDEDVVVQLHGYEHVNMPEDLQRRVLENQEPEQWADEKRGYVYEAVPSEFPSGDPCVEIRVIKSPEDRESFRDFDYKVVKTGRGKTLSESIAAAFDSEGVEKVGE